MRHKNEDQVKDDGKCWEEQNTKYDLHLKKTGNVRMWLEIQYFYFLLGCNCEYKTS